MGIDPQVAIPASVALSVLAFLSQLVTHFTKKPDNGNTKQIEINTANIAKLEIDVRSSLLKLTVIEEQVKSNVLEILNLRPRIHFLGNEITRLSNDIVHLQEDEERRRGKRT